MNLTLEIALGLYNNDGGIQNGTAIVVGVSGLPAAGLIIAEGSAGVDAAANPVGVSAVSGIGSITTTASAVSALPSVIALAAAGDLAATAAALASVPGISAASSSGQVTASGETGSPDGTAFLFGVAAGPSVGSITGNQPSTVTGGGSFRPVIIPPRQSWPAAAAITGAAVVPAVGLVSISSSAAICLSGASAANQAGVIVAVVDHAARHREEECLAAWLLAA